MKFFIPHEPDAAKAEKLYEAIRKLAKNTLGWKITRRRIFRLTISDNGKECHAEVGKQDPLTGELVVAILDSNCYLVCTPIRGMRKGDVPPVMVAKDESAWAEEFEK
jgi:hypothetical protein